VVLGTSIGYFPLLAHLLFGTPAVGYELLCSDVKEAKRIARKHQVQQQQQQQSGSASMHVRCGADLLTPLARAQVDMSPGQGVRFFCDDARNAELHEATVCPPPNPPPRAAQPQLLSGQLLPAPSMPQQPGQSLVVIDFQVIWLNSAVWSVPTRSAMYAKITAEAQVCLCGALALSTCCCGTLRTTFVVREGGTSALELGQREPLYF
jgi:hypothetical protein